MKKIFFLFVICSQITFGQDLTKEELINKLSEETCTCIKGKEFTKDNFELTLGLCMIEGVSKYEKDVKKFYGDKPLTDKGMMEKLGEAIGEKLVFTCPEFLVLVQQMDDSSFESEGEIEELVISGKFSGVKPEQFLTFVVKEKSGKSHTFLVLEDFENSYLLVDNVLKSSDSVKVSYYEASLYDPNVKKFVTYKVVIDIVKE